VDGQPIYRSTKQGFLQSDSGGLHPIDGGYFRRAAREYGDKTSVCREGNERASDSDNAAHGQLTTSYVSFGSVTGGANVAFGIQSWGISYL